MMRLLSILLTSTTDLKVKHYLGLPPELTGGVDTRQQMGAAAYLVIEPDPEGDGVFLYRYDALGECVGDTWHTSIDEAKHQANYEYESFVQDWQDVPAEVDDAVVFGLERLKKMSGS